MPSVIPGLNPSTQYILFMFSVYYLTVLHLQYGLQLCVERLERSTAMRRTPLNSSEHRRNSTGCLEMTYLPSDAGKITLISYLFSVLSSLLLNKKCLFLLNYLLYFFTLFNVSFFRRFLRRLSKPLLVVSGQPSLLRSLPDSGCIVGQRSEVRGLLWRQYQSPSTKSLGTSYTPHCTDLGCSSIRHPLGVIAGKSTPE